MLRHKLYSLRLPQWIKIRDVFEGEDRVKEMGTAYLPMLGSQRSGGVEGAEQYENYKARASFYPAAKRTAQGLVGAVTRKDAAMTGVPPEQEKVVRDHLGQGFQAAKQVAANALTELVTIGRCGLLVDCDSNPDAAPYVVLLRAEEIVHWEATPIDGRLVPTMIVLEQDYTETKPNDRFGTQSVPRKEWRCLRLGFPDEMILEAADGAFDGAGDLEPVYWQEIWRANEDKASAAGRVNEGLLLHRVIVPTKRGGRFWREIPCDVVNAISGIALDCEEPQMLDLVNTQLAHYRGSADLEWGRHMCAIPQPWVAGFDVRDGEQLVVGCGFAWQAGDPNAKASYLEFSGSGLGAIVEGQKEKLAQMATLGSRMLESQPSGVEAMGTVRLRQSGERSVLATIAGHASAAMTRAIQRVLSWLSPAFESDEQQAQVAYQLSTDFEAQRLDPAELTALMTALQGGTMSWETFAYNLRRGEMLPDGVTAEEERERIQAGAPGRSRVEEMRLLQADVQAGRISDETYLQQMQALGLYSGVDVAAEVEKAEQQKARAVENQMLALAGRGGAFGDLGGGADDPEDAPPEGGGGEQ